MGLFGGQVELYGQFLEALKDLSEIGFCELKCYLVYDVNPHCLASIWINSRMKFAHQLSQKRILTFIRFSAHKTRIGTITNQDERGHSEMQFRHKKHQ